MITKCYNTRLIAIVFVLMKQVVLLFDLESICTCDILQIVKKLDNIKDLFTVQCDMSDKMKLIKITIDHSKL